MVLRNLLTAMVIGLFAFPYIPVKSQGYPQQVIVDKPPEVIQGGEWIDHFWTDQWMSAKYNTEFHFSHLHLMFEEPLHWTQTWTAHFVGGDFFQTEAISDSVRLAPNGPGEFFTTGVYTSTVLNAGKPADWSSSSWAFSGVPGSLIVEFRTGNVPIPDYSWTVWTSPRIKIGEYTCVYIIGSYKVECLNNMSGIDSSQYIQYRASFSSNDSTKTVALNAIDLVYGIHPLTGTAWSALIAPADLGEWQTVIISSTVPANTTLAIDILAADGTVLAQNVGNGDSLAMIDPLAYPALQLRASFTTMDTSLTPDVDLWGLRWSVATKLYLPVVFR